ncbi:MAG: nuclear transport factor 2 family protein [Proteobacteria bacterium]|nr:nuclear transport factor 2 family protein [Pseudomonadota bacterium]
MSQEEENRALIRAFWRDLYAREFDKVGAYFAEHGLYEDVPAPDRGAVGPRNVTARLRIGLDPIDNHTHQQHRMVAEGDTVVTEHTEDWHFHTGEVVSLPFVSIHVIEAGKIVLWRDYWDLGTLMSGAPSWWIERLATFSQADFS